MDTQDITQRQRIKTQFSPRYLVSLISSGGVKPLNVQESGLSSQFLSLCSCLTHRIYRPQAKDSGCQQVCETNARKRDSREKSSTIAATSRTLMYTIWDVTHNSTEQHLTTIGTKNLY